MSVSKKIQSKCNMFTYFYLKTKDIDNLAFSHYYYINIYRCSAFAGLITETLTETFYLIYL